MDGIVVNLTNHYNLAYAADLYFGSGHVRNEVIFDTGSGWLTVSTANCTTCTRRAYDPLVSNTSLVNLTSDYKQISVSNNP